MLLRKGGTEHITQQYCTENDVHKCVFRSATMFFTLKVHSFLFRWFHPSYETFHFGKVDGDIVIVPFSKLQRPFHAVVGGR